MSASSRLTAGNQASADRGASVCQAADGEYGWMPNGKPGDHPLTDIVVYELEVFGPRADALIREIVGLGGEAELERRFDLLDLDPSFAHLRESDAHVDLRELEVRLGELRDELRQDRIARGWEVDDMTAGNAPARFACPDTAWRPVGGTSGWPLPLRAVLDWRRFNWVMVLSECAANAELLAYLRSSAQPATGKPWADLDGFELHTHPDLIERLGELAGSPRAVVAFFGVVGIVVKGLAAVVALGTDILLLRLPAPPEGVRFEPSIEPMCARGWYACRPGMTSHQHSVGRVGWPD